MIFTGGAKEHLTIVGGPVNSLRSVQLLLFVSTILSLLRLPSVLILSLYLHVCVHKLCIGLFYYYIPFYVFRDHLSFSPLYVYLIYCTFNYLASTDNY